VKHADSLLVSKQNSDFTDKLELSSTNNGTSNNDHSPQQSNEAKFTQSLLATGEKVLLQTAIVSIQGENGQVVRARVLLDSASQRTFMTNQLAQRLKLSIKHKECLSVSTFGASKATNIDTYVVNFKVYTNDGSDLTLSANVLKQITGSIQRNPLLQKDLEFLKLFPSNKLADAIPSTSKSVAVDLLIGSDYFWDIVSGDKVTLPSGMFMIPSKFGYIITGKCFDNQQRSQDNQSHAFLVTTEINHIIPELCLKCTINTSGVNNPRLEDLWCLEAVGINDPLMMNDDDEALEKFNKSIKFDRGRYQVTWPWKCCLSDNYSLALSRIKILMNRLQSDKELLLVLSNNK